MNIQEKIEKELVKYWERTNAMRIPSYLFLGYTEWSLLYIDFEWGNLGKYVAEKNRKEFAKSRYKGMKLIPVSLPEFLHVS